MKFSWTFYRQSFVSSRHLWVLLFLCVFAKINTQDDLGVVFPSCVFLTFNRGHDNTNPNNALSSGKSLCIVWFPQNGYLSDPCFSTSKNIRIFQVPGASQILPSGSSTSSRSWHNPPRKIRVASWKIRIESVFHGVPIRCYDIPRMKCWLGMNDGTLIFGKNIPYKYYQRACTWKFMGFGRHTVDGRNPAITTPGMYKTLEMIGYLPYQLVQDFCHQPYLFLFVDGFLTGPMLV